MIVCSCNVVTDHQAVAARARGLSWKQFVRATGISAGCGRCVLHARSIFGQAEAGTYRALVSASTTQRREEMTDFKDMTQEEIKCRRPDSIGLARNLLKVARNKSLPVQYRHHLARLAREIYAGLVDENDRGHLAVESIVAYTTPFSPMSEKKEAFTRLIEIQNRMGATDKQRSSALGNLARLYQWSGKYLEAADLYRQARELVSLGESGSDYLDSQLADCLAHLGKYKEAYYLISHFPSDYFGLREQERNETRPGVP